MGKSASQKEIKGQEFSSKIKEYPQKSETQLSLQSTELIGQIRKQKHQSELAPFQVSINSVNIGLLSPNLGNRSPDPLNVTHMSIKSVGAQSIISNTKIESEGGEMVFYESEYFYSTMPTSLPSDLQKGVSPQMNRATFNNRPVTPTSNLLKANLSSMSPTKSTFSLFNQSQSGYKKLKLQNLDLDELIKDSQIKDQYIPKFFKINVPEIYAKTGLPKPAKKAKDEEKEIFMVQNLFRVYRRLLIQILEDYADYVKRNTKAHQRYNSKGGDGMNENDDQPMQISISMKEGMSAILDAISFVKTCPPLKPFYHNKYMSKVCKIHATECAKLNYTGHKNKKGEKPSEVMKKYGHLFYGGAQNILNGSKFSVESVLNQIIDDGVKNRGHRKNILNPAHRTLGIASENHPSMGIIVVCNYAFHYCKNNQPDPLQSFIKEWVAEDQNEIMKQTQILQGDKFKYKVTFQYPFLIKNTTIVRTDNQGNLIPINEIVNRKNAEAALYNEEI